MTGSGWTGSDWTGSGFFKIMASPVFKDRKERLQKAPLSTKRVVLNMFNSSGALITY